MFPPKKKNLRMTATETSGKSNKALPKKKKSYKSFTRSGRPVPGKGNFNAMTMKFNAMTTMLVNHNVSLTP